MAPEAMELQDVLADEGTPTKKSLKEQIRDKKVNCRICGGEHYAARCPKKDTMAPVGGDNEPAADPTTEDGEQAPKQEKVGWRTPQAHGTIRPQPLAEPSPDSPGEWPGLPPFYFKRSMGSRDSYLSTPSYSSLFDTEDSVYNEEDDGFPLIENNVPHHAYDERRERQLDNDSSSLTSTTTASIPGRSASAEAIASIATAGGVDMIDIIRSIIAQEMGMELDEIVESTDLSNLGMSSLMVLTILGKLREEHDIDLDPPILVDNPTFGHLRKALGLDVPAPALTKTKSAKRLPVPYALREMDLNARTVHEDITQDYRYRKQATLDEEAGEEAPYPDIMAKEEVSTATPDILELTSNAAQMSPEPEVVAIPPGEREAKPDGAFAGLEGLIVRKDGLVEDHEGNVVGKVVEGDVTRLVGRGVDEDGDIIDKYGNVKGHVEPYEEPEEAGPEDLSSLAGKTVNRPGRQLSRAQERADATTPNPIEHSQPPEKPKEAALVHRVFSRTKDFGIANSLPKGEEDMDVTSAIHDETDELVLQYTHIQKSELAGLREELSRAMMQI